MNIIKIMIVLSVFAGSAFAQVKYNDTTRLYTPKGELASVSFYDNNYILQFEKIFWQYLPNGEYAFVSKTGFVTVKNGESVTLDSSTPDNITQIGIDDKMNENTYIWKNGKKEIYTGGMADGVRQTLYEGDRPGVYEWRKGKLKFVRKLNDNDMKEKEQADQIANDMLKMMNMGTDSTRQK